MSWLKKGIRSYKASPEKYKDDQGWSRGHKESVKMHECNETRYYGWQDNRKMQNMWKTNLSTRKNVMHIDPKHTHTLKKFNQFYISKTSHDSLVSIHEHM